MSGRPSISERGLGRRALVAGSVLTAAAPGARGSSPIRLSLNENPYGPSPRVDAALAANLPDVNRYGDDSGTDTLLDGICALEHVGRDQIVLGEILGPLGLFLAAQPPAGGRFVLSVPGYTALVDAGRPLGATMTGVPLDPALRNDLPALLRAVGTDARALYLVNPHNPSGTVNEAAAFDSFLRQASAHTLVIVDEAYLEYDDVALSAVRLTREGRNVAVFRTLDKIYGLAGLPIGYLVAPRALAASLRAGGFGDPHELGRLAVAAANAALADQGWIAQVRRRTIASRGQLEAALDRLGLKRSQSVANFVFFQAPPHVASPRAALAREGILVARPFPPLADWIRVTVGTESETRRTIAALDQVFAR